MSPRTEYDQEVKEISSFVRFIPTIPEQIDAFFELAPLSQSDVVYDLGSGDGRLLFAALEKGAGKAVGVEFNPELVRQAREIATNKGLQDRVTFLEADVMQVTLSGASVIFCYLSANAPLALRPRFDSELKSGVRIVMEFFPVPGWKPVRTIEKERKRFYLYIMPPEITEVDTDSDPLLDYLSYPI
jgi:ubiquinone/menaquinone biosynthesis C-methylase UbiE